MKLVVAGSRNWEDKEAVYTAIYSVHRTIPITEIVSGGCKGVDTIAEEWAFDNKVPVTRFPAKWEEYGPAAGPIRNDEMALYADAALVLRFTVSKGSENMVERANMHCIPCWEIVKSANGEMKLYVYENELEEDDEGE